MDDFTLGAGATPADAGCCRGEATLLRTLRPPLPARPAAISAARRPLKPLSAALFCAWWVPFRKRFVAMLIIIGVLLAGCGQDHPPDPAIEKSQLPAIAHDGTIVAVGDSLTAGLGVPEADAYPAQLARRLQDEGYTYRVINAGVSGETSSGTLSRIEWVVSSLSPDIVILVTGANDGLRGLDPNLLKANLDQLVSRLRSHKVDVILAGMLMLPNLGPDYTRAYSAIFPEVADKHGILFIPFFLEGVAGQAHLNQPDKVHPTADGYARIVETVYPYVVKAIQRHRAR